MTVDKKGDTSVQMGATPRPRTLIVGFTCVFLSLLIPWTKASRLGSCFRVRYKNSNGCGHLLRLGISQEGCCTGHYRRAWSPDASPTQAQGYGPQGHTLRNTSFVAVHNQIWIEGDLLAHSGKRGKQRHSDQDCQPCTTSCKDVICGEDRKCILRNGIPKCVCNPKCHLQHKAAVCGTDGRTYSSECQLLKRSCRKKQRLLVAHSGPCQTCSGVRCKKKRACVLDELLTPRCQKCPKSCANTRRKRAICGTDGVTYTSKCFLKMASCQAGVIISKAYKGPCQENGDCDNVKCWRGETCLHDFTTNRPKCQWCGDLRHCPSTATHICASDRNTYQSWCALTHTSCRTGTALTAIAFHHCAKNSTKARTTRNKKCPKTTQLDIDKQKLNQLMEKKRREKDQQIFNTSAGNHSHISNATSTTTELKSNINWDAGTEGSLLEESQGGSELRKARKRKRNFKRRKGAQNDARRKKRKKKKRNEC